MRYKYIKKNIDGNGGLPHAALFRRIHGAAQWAIVGAGEVARIRKWPQDTDESRRVDRGPDLGQSVLRPHRSTPDLGVVEKEQLVVGHVQAGQLLLPPVQCLPFLVGLEKKRR